jgi:hypothetical protein
MPTLHHNGGRLIHKPSKGHNTFLLFEDDTKRVSQENFLLKKQETEEEVRELLV